MIIGLNKDGYCFGVGIEIEDNIFHLCGPKGYAERILTGCYKGLLMPMPESNVYVTRKFIFIGGHGAIEYDENNKVVRACGKNMEYSPNGDIARIGNAVVAGFQNSPQVQEQYDKFCAKHKSHNDYSWKFTSSGDILSYNGIKFEYGEYIDFGGDYPWSYRQVLSSIGDVPIKYHPDGRVRWVDGRDVTYDSRGRISGI